MEEKNNPEGRGGAKRTAGGPAARRARGRPQKGDAPVIPYEEIDRLLVFGEQVPCDDGATTTTSFPSYRDLATRYGVSASLIANYAKSHHCLRRREQAKERIAKKADDKFVELRATATALSKDDAIRMIDSYLRHFEKALAEGRVRADNPTDFNTMVRLKEFVLAGGDGRPELEGLTLDQIQGRHAQMIRAAREASGEETGMVRGALMPGEAESIQAAMPSEVVATIDMPDDKEEAS
jgi:hypothetical protein